MPRKHDVVGKQVLFLRTPSLQVSWLGAWALLLGCRDHKTEADMWSGRPHLRPSEAEMLGLYQQWARTAAAAEVRGRVEAGRWGQGSCAWQARPTTFAPVRCHPPDIRPGSPQHPIAPLPPSHLLLPAPQALPLDLTPEHAAGPGCAALVADMCGLFGELKRLSHLEQGGELEVRGGVGCEQAWFVGTKLGAADCPMLALKVQDRPRQAE